LNFANIEIFISKPSLFAMGVRIEHPQSLIDSLQYHQRTRTIFACRASYSLVAQTYFKGVQRGVFSFCMCPGDLIVPPLLHQANW
jgi:uncharacterized FAD-dependent dehydrogenase